MCEKDGKRKSEFSHPGFIGISNLPESSASTGESKKVLVVKVLIFDDLLKYLERKTFHCQLDIRSENLYC